MRRNTTKLKEKLITTGIEIRAKGIEQLSIRIGDNFNEKVIQENVSTMLDIYMEGAKQRRSRLTTHIQTTIATMSLY